MELMDYFTSAQGGDTAFSVEATKIKLGPGSLVEIGADAKEFGMKRVAVYTDATVAKLEPVNVVVRSLRSAGLEVDIFDETEIEPTDRSFKAGTAFAQEGKFDGFVSVGGGSVMDTAKASNLYSTYPDDFLAYVNAPIGQAKPIPGPLRPHIACPTTFGTASECTGIAIFDLLEMEAKTGIAGSRLKPSLGILDPTNLETLPKEIMAANGFDVFSHAVESITARPYTHRPAPLGPGTRPLSQGANPYSDISCLEAIRLVGLNLVKAVNEPDNKYFEPLMFASMLAGIGFGNAGCHLPHGMSYAVSGLVRDYRPPGWPVDHPMVPHGISVIVNSPSVFRFMASACPERHMMAAKSMGAKTEGASPEDAGGLLADRIVEMMRQTGMPNGLSGVGYSEDDLDALTEKAFPQKRVIDNAPKKIDKDQLKSIFQDAMVYW
ncbi:MAG: iron-containing alcohol dehydrogenase [Proteobacteria bacterium]|nr:iron-containing alcohol dehydrogenase [Pseudomonadota bacterium]